MIARIVYSFLVLCGATAFLGFIGCVLAGVATLMVMVEAL